MDTMWLRVGRGNTSCNPVDMVSVSGVEPPHGYLSTSGIGMKMKKSSGLSIYPEGFYVHLP